MTVSSGSYSASNFTGSAHAFVRCIRHIRRRDFQRQGTPSAAITSTLTASCGHPLQRPPADAARAPGHARRRGRCDDKGEPANATWTVLEALQGHRRPMHADPSRDTARLTDRLAPSCHERHPGGLWRRAGPLDANLGILWGEFQGCGTGGARAPGRRVSFLWDRFRRPRGGPESPPRNRVRDPTPSWPYRRWPRQQGCFMSDTYA
jgi:hypothetical protein